ncbi:MAG: hypothetical protein IKC01_05305 [Clostridia bacterium]|nr:hypothetical protein [Clostridia bacterium]
MFFKYKKILNYIVVILITSIVLALVNIGFIPMHKYLVLQNKEANYLNDKSFINWIELCDELFGSDEYEMILEYFPDYLESDELYMTYLGAAGDNSFASLGIVNGYRYIYAEALLKTGMYDEFESYIYELNNLYAKNSIQDSLYIVISDCILTSEYNNEELHVLLNVIEKIYDDCITDKFKYQNLCIQSYINDKLEDEEKYNLVQKDISRLNNY